MVRPHNVWNSFSTSGFEVRKHLLSAAVMDKTRNVLGVILASLSPNHPLWDLVVPSSDLKSTRNPGVDPEKIKNVPFILSELPRFSPEFLKLICEESLWDLAREILQSNSVVYHFSNITRKPAYVGPNLSWHRDYPNEFICPRDSANFFRMLIPLDGMSADNGCTTVIPGTHHLSDVDAQNRKQDKQLDYSIDAAIELDAEPGDVIALHPKVVHGGKENRSELDRNLIVIQFGITTDAYLSRTAELFSGWSRERILG